MTFTEWLDATFTKIGSGVYSGLGEIEKRLMERAFHARDAEMAELKWRLAIWKAIDLCRPCPHGNDPENCPMCDAALQRERDHEIMREPDR